jgi:hypothetical protein
MAAQLSSTAFAASTRAPCNLQARRSLSGAQLQQRPRWSIAAAAQRRPTADLSPEQQQAALDKQLKESASRAAKDVAKKAKSDAPAGSVIPVKKAPRKAAAAAAKKKVGVPLLQPLASAHLLMPSLPSSSALLLTASAMPASKRMLACCSG